MDHSLLAQQKQRDAYNIASSYYEYKMEHTFTGKINSIVRKKSILSLKPQREDRIIDIGAGDGAISILAAKSGAEVVGFDIADKMIELGKTRIVDGNLNLRLYVDDAENFKEKESYFDKALCINVVHRLSNPEKCLASTYNCLKPGGKLVVFTMNNASPQFSLIKIYSKLRDFFNIPLLDTVAKKGFTSNQIQSLVNKAGFDIEKIHTEIFIFPYFNVHCPSSLATLLQKIDHVLSRIPFFNRLGVFIVVEATKRK